MLNYFTFNGTDSRDFGVYISGQGTFNAPERAYSLMKVPGRDGALVGFDNRLENVELTYPAFICSNFSQNMEDFRSFLLSQVGYQKLVDSYHPNEYRMAIYPGAFEAEVTSLNDAGQFDITFVCKPQRFLNSGDNVTTLTASTSISNPTLFNAQPLMRVYGTGVLGIGSQSVTISTADSFTDIDCEMMDCYKGTASKNRYVSFSNYKFPVLSPGTNNITLGTGITKVEITPRWWVL